MSLDNGTNEAPQIDDDLNTTAPQSKPETWSMPEPVYRQTSGKLPQGYAKSIESEASTGEIISEAPNVSSDSNPAPAASTPSQEIVEPRPKSPTLKIVVVILGLVGMIGFLIAFLTVIYFFFLRSSE